MKLPVRLSALAARMREHKGVSRNEPGARAVMTRNGFLAAIAAAAATRRVC
ncbi:hypothetical protein [Pandoraea sp. CB10b_02]|uniref:hypothetical protein n=1 Tax=Pandoraea sp. CB10b_02 TaxID=2014535 RepID=UPI00257B564F|nr:hypothetical protein [Pandoraea sp. CB10b_02]